MKPLPLLSVDQSHRSADSLSDGRSTTSRFNGTNGLPKSNDGLSGLNYGINLPNPTPYLASGLAGGPARVALKMAVDGALVLLKVSSVVDGAGGRGAADRGESSGKVSRKVTSACDVRLWDAWTRLIRSLERGSPRARRGECGEPIAPKGARWGSEGDGWKHR